MKHFNKFQWGLKGYTPTASTIWHVTPEQRDEYIKLDWNEGTIPPSPCVSKRIHKLMEKENFYNLYPNMTNGEIDELLSKFIGLPAEYFSYFVGSDTVHECVARSFLAPGDSVLMLGPSYDNFRLTAETTGARVFFSEVDSEFVFDPAKFEGDIEAIKPSFVYICSPNNPTGHLHGIDYIKYLIEKYPETMFLLDEAYWEFAKKTVCSLVVDHDNIVVTRTMSKAFCLANFRFGYVISNPENVAHMKKIRNPKNINSFTQAAVCGVLEDTDYMWAYVDEVNAAKDWFYAELQKRSDKLKVYFGYANALLVKFPTVEDKLAMEQYLKDNKIFVRALKQSTLLAPCLRISIGTRAQMEKVLACMDERFAQQTNVF